MAALRSALFALFFYSGTVFWVTLASLAALIGKRPLTAVVRGWTKSHYWGARHFLGIRTRIEGTLPEGPVLVAAKHQAMYETLEMVRILGEPAVVLKRELADVPGWGRVAQLYGCIPVDRAGGGTALRRMMKAAQAAIAEGRSIVIFPEGTRVPPGERPPLMPGFAGLYKALRLPLVPVALDSGLLLPRRRFIKRPGTITFRFGDPIPPGLPRQEIESRVHAAINALEKPEDPAARSG